MGRVTGPVASAGLAPVLYMGGSSPFPSMTQASYAAANGRTISLSV
jgi:hypothetical protein